MLTFLILMTCKAALINAFIIVMDETMWSVTDGCSDKSAENDNS